MRWRYHNKRKAEQAEQEKLERVKRFHEELELQNRDDVVQKLLGWGPSDRIARIAYFQKLRQEEAHWKKNYSSRASEEEWEFLKQQPDHFDSKSDWEKRRPKWPQDHQ